MPCRWIALILMLFIFKKLFQGAFNFEGHKTTFDCIPYKTVTGSEELEAPGTGLTMQESSINC